MPKTIYTTGEIYHIYNRGVNRQEIFFEERHWEFFLKRLRVYFTPDRAEILAYCLMPNHYHLLVYMMTDEFSKQVMQPFGTSYTKAINKDQKRVGPLFQGSFKGIHVESGSYLLHLSRYIHRNPVDVGLATHPEDWVYSSYRDYIGLRLGTLPKMDLILDAFQSASDYAAFVNDVNVKDDSIKELMLE